MPRKRMQSGSLLKDGPWWRARWYELVPTGDGPKNVRRNEIVGPAEGPQRISKKEAQRRMQEDILQHVNARAYVPASCVTLTQFVASKFEPEVIWSMKHSGKLHYSYCLKKILDAMGTCPLKEITVERITAFFKKMLDEEYSIQTVTHMKNALSAVIQYAKTCRMYHDDNPARLVKLPEMTRTKKPALSFEQAQIVLENLEEPYKTMALMAMTTSLNAAELTGLTWKRVNLGDRPVLVGDDLIPPMAFAVRENWYRGRRGTVKTQARNRIQPLVPALASALLSIRTLTPFNGPDDPVFASRNGTPIDAHNANKRVFKRVGKLAGVPGLSWHSFRRTTATLTGLLGMPKADRVALMGHSDGAMTDYYSDSDIERRRLYTNELASRMLPLPPKSSENVVPDPVTPTVRDLEEWYGDGKDDHSPASDKIQS